MPCSDVTEYCQVDLDNEGRVVALSLRKNTCGAPVGNALLLSYVKERAADEVLGATLRTFIPQVHQARHLDQFLLGKQLYALQSAIAVYLGSASGGKDDPFVVERIEHGPDRTHIAGLLRVDLATEQIRACGNCGCASRAAK